jgi:hypothetical protein
MPMHIQRVSIARLLFLALTLIANACYAEFRTGFITSDAGYSPKANGFFNSNSDQLEVPNAKDSTIIIYQHGHGPFAQPEDCRKSYNAVPEALYSVEDKFTKVFFLCSAVFDEVGKPGSTLDKRIQEFKIAIDSLVQLGVRRERIFLAGHSTGGWAALLMQSDVQDIGGSILFAPAATGKKSDISIYPYWKTKARPKWVEQILSSPKVDALIFAYQDDPFEGPEDLTFLSERFPTTINLIAYKCPSTSPNQHFVPFGDCRLSDSIREIKGYIMRKLLKNAN